MVIKTKKRGKKSVTSGHPRSGTRKTKNRVLFRVNDENPHSVHTKNHKNDKIFFVWKILHEKRGYFSCGFEAHEKFLHAGPNVIVKITFEDLITKTAPGCHNLI